MIDVGSIVDASKGPLAALFNEELGFVVQTRSLPAVREILEKHKLGSCYHVIGNVSAPGDDEITFKNGTAVVLHGTRTEFIRLWSQTSYHLQALRDHVKCAEQEFARLLDVADPGLHAHLTFSYPLPIISSSIGFSSAPRVAILREQGVNGHVEMAAAFARVGFCSVDVHMTDLIEGRVRLDGFVGLVACGGFSYGDVLGAGAGWAKSVLYNDNVRAAFVAFISRKDTFVLGVCNGCQMLSNLRELIPGAERWPQFVRNESEQFEARVCMVEVMNTPSIFFANMAGTRLPLAVAHGEGRAEFDHSADMSALRDARLLAMRFVDNYGLPTQTYPMNPNGSPEGITALTTPDGRVTILMPHPERVVRTVNNSWHPDNWQNDSPWLKMFLNARDWVEKNVSQGATTTAF